ARVLVDTGPHYQSQNIEQIVAWLLHLRLLGGFHFNDPRYADDDLVIGSIDPYQVFRIFHEILSEPDVAVTADIAFMIDQSHNLKGKMEAMVQTVMAAQELFAKAALIDQARLGELQQDCRLVEAEECFRGAFWQDVRPVVREWRGGPRPSAAALPTPGARGASRGSAGARTLVVFRVTHSRTAHPGAPFSGGTSYSSSTKFLSLSGTAYTMGSHGATEDRRQACCHPPCSHQDDC